MDQERHEVYERIPWETLEKRGADRQWVAYALAGAVTLGALAYSFTRNQPVGQPDGAVQEVVVTTVVTPEVVPTVGSPLASPSPSPSASPSAPPIVVSEADLFAVDPERLIDQVSALAEWFAVEYFAADGSPESSEVLAAMLPAGVPAPIVPDGTQVFVDWVGSQSVTQTGPLDFEVGVLVRSLVSDGGGEFARVAARRALIAVKIGPDGLAHISGLPVVEIVEPAVAVGDAPGPVPDDLKSALEASHGQVIGGFQLADGRWQVVVMEIGPDGVRRPTTVYR